MQPNTGKKKWNHYLIELKFSILHKVLRFFYFELSGEQAVTAEQVRWSASPKTRTDLIVKHNYNHVKKGRKEKLQENN